MGQDVDLTCWVTWKSRADHLEDGGSICQIHCIVDPNRAASLEISQGSFASIMKGTLFPMAPLAEPMGSVELRNNFPRFVSMKEFVFRDPYAIRGKYFMRTNFFTEASSMDDVARVGPQLGSWTDSESALRTLSAWFRMFCKRGSSTGDRNASNLTPNRDSLFEFAQTIMAGVPLSENTRLDDLTPLVDWLHLFLHEPDEVIERMNGDQGQSPGQTEIVPFQQHIQRATEGRVFFTTHRGLTGLGPASMESDDTINVLPGGKTYYVLRSANPKDARELRNPRYAGVLPMVLIGDCYLNDG